MNPLVNNTLDTLYHVVHPIRLRHQSTIENVRSLLERLNTLEGFTEESFQRLRSMNHAIFQIDVDLAKKTDQMMCSKALQVLNIRFLTTKEREFASLVISKINSFRVIYNSITAARVHSELIPVWKRALELGMKEEMYISFFQKTLEEVEFVKTHFIQHLSRFKNFKRLIIIFEILPRELERLQALEKLLKDKHLENICAVDLSHLIRGVRRLKEPEKAVEIYSYLLHLQNSNKIAGNVTELFKEASKFGDFSSIQCYCAKALELTKCYNVFFLRTLCDLLVGAQPLLKMPFDQEQKNIRFSESIDFLKECRRKDPVLHLTIDPILFRLTILYGKEHALQAYDVISSRQLNGDQYKDIVWGLPLLWENTEPLLTFLKEEHPNLHKASFVSMLGKLTSFSTVAEGIQAARYVSQALSQLSVEQKEEQTEMLLISLESKSYQAVESLFEAFFYLKREYADQFNTRDLQQLLQLTNNDKHSHRAARIRLAVAMLQRLNSRVDEQKLRVNFALQLVITACYSEDTIVSIESAFKDLEIIDPNLRSKIFFQDLLAVYKKIPEKYVALTIAILNKSKNSFDDSVDIDILDAIEEISKRLQTRNFQPGELERTLDLILSHHFDHTAFECFDYLDILFVVSATGLLREEINVQSSDELVKRLHYCINTYFDGGEGQEISKVAEIVTYYSHFFFLNEDSEIVVKALALVDADDNIALHRRMVIESTTPQLLQATVQQIEDISVRFDFSKIAQEAQGLTVPSAALPNYITDQTWNEYIDPLLEKINLEGLTVAVEQEVPIDLEQLKTNLGSTYLRHCLDKLSENLTPSQIHFASLLIYLHHLSCEVSEGETFSERELQLLALAKVVQECDGGKKEGLAAFYFKVLPYEYRLEQRVEALGEEQMKEVLSGWTQEFLYAKLSEDSPMMRELCATQEEIKQLPHHAKFLRNLLGPHIGLRQPVSFDPHMDMVSQALRFSGVQQAFEVFDRHVRPLDLIHFMLEKYVQLPDEGKGATKGKLYQALSDKFGIDSEHWDRETGLPTGPVFFEVLQRMGLLARG